MSSKAVSLREKILKLNDLSTDVIKVKEWGLDITVRELPLGTRTSVLAMHQTHGPSEAICATVVAGTLDEEGNQLFTEEDAAALADKSEAAMIELYKAILKLSGVDVGDGEKQESEAEKPSETAPVSMTTTD